MAKWVRPNIVLSTKRGGRSGLQRFRRLGNRGELKRKKEERAGQQTAGKNK